MNDTKWNELRLAMYELKPAPKWRTKDIENGYLSEWDSEWYYHFRDGGYSTIEWVEIRITSPEQKECILEKLAKIHVPIESTSESIKVFGYIKTGQFVEYAKL